MLISISFFIIFHFFHLSIYSKLLIFLLIIFILKVNLGIFNFIYLFFNLITTEIALSFSSIVIQFKWIIKIV
jgi:hypothetical protein